MGSSVPRGDLYPATYNWCGYVAEQWYFTHGGQQQGPVDSATLMKLASTGQLIPSDLVWQEGMPQWALASSLQGLFGVPEASAHPSEELQTHSTTPSVPPPVVRKESFQSRIAKARRRQFMPATSWLDLFDWQFKKYLTPLIVRLTWVVVLVMASLALVGLAVVACTSWLPEAETQWISPDTNVPSGPTYELTWPALPRWLTLRLVMTATLLFQAVGIMVFVLWIRVVLESVIVLFNISMTLTSIEQTLEEE